VITRPPRGGLLLLLLEIGAGLDCCGLLLLLEIGAGLLGCAGLLKLVGMLSGLGGLFEGLLMLLVKGLGGC